ncbi:VOC family protein [Microbacterium sp. H83]|uniref:VOC family protein n=1 Tax=Microbacterium sp. H83 TaxID=1827324 RepID=UPI0007F4C0A3|nr:VOC family protein [Microbacterium sp. H83]OAN33679.1 hypothetical protein A4X16_06760 [Microbacterium sp. H83]
MVVSSLFPILRTSDLPRLQAFYEAAFGAVVTYRFDHEGVDVYVALAVGDGALAIGFAPDAVRGDAVAVWLYTDDADAAFARAVAAGAGAVSAPADQPWGERVAEVRDPDGNPLYLATAG